jgi:hypothetical protein
MKLKILAGATVLAVATTVPAAAGPCRDCLKDKFSNWGMIVGTAAAFGGMGAAASGGWSIVGGAIIGGVAGLVGVAASVGGCAAICAANPEPRTATTPTPTPTPTPTSVPTPPGAGPGHALTPSGPFRPTPNVSVYGPAYIPPISTPPRIFVVPGPTRVPVRPPVSGAAPTGGMPGCHHKPAASTQHCPNKPATAAAFQRVQPAPFRQRAGTQFKPVRVQQFKPQPVRQQFKPQPLRVQQRNFKIPARVRGF